MKILVILPLILLVVRADSSDKQDMKTKTSQPQQNTIQQSPKYETFFQPIKYAQQQLQQVAQPQHYIQRPQYIPVQIIPRPYYVPPQNQPHAMIIIAQPTLLPQSLVYGNPTQQLLNYFHSNPQAKYQLLHGNQQQQQQPQPVAPTPTLMHHVITAPTLGSYILTPAPQYQHVQPVQYQQPVPQQPSAPSAPARTVPVTAPSTQYTPQQPAKIGAIAQLAQLAAQQYSQLKSAPALVTGFEHFTAEQQAQIKQQLATHFGSNFHVISNPVNQYSAKYVAQQQQQQQQSNDFVPSPQVTTASSTNDILKSRYVNNKN